MPRRVLLFGATSAIVAETARRLAARGDRLYCIARGADRLAALVQELGPAVVGSEVADVCDTDGHADRVARAVVALGGLDVALLGHGLLPDQRATEVDWSTAERALAVNLGGTIALLIPLAEAMERQGHGTIAVITSVAGQRGRPRNYTYGAAKGGLSVYLQGLRSRLYRSGVRVVDLRPGPVHTPMTVGHTPNPLFATTTQVSAGIVRALDRGTPVVWLPAYWRPILAVVRWLPEPVFQRIQALSGR